MKIQLKRRQAGLTLVEVLLVLAIAAVAIVGGTILFGQASESQQTNDAIRQFNQLQAGIKSLYTGSPDYGASQNLAAALYSANKVPGDMRGSAAGVIRSVFGSTVTITSDATGATFTITMPDVPKGPCISIVGALGKQIDGANITQITVPGQTFTTAAPATVATATTGCSGATNSIAVTYN